MVICAPFHYELAKARRSSRRPLLSGGGSCRASTRVEEGPAPLPKTRRRTDALSTQDDEAQLARVKARGMIRHRPPAPRFKFGDMVEVRTDGPNGSAVWALGRIIKLWYFEAGFDSVAPYQVRLEFVDRRIYAPEDSDDLIRRPLRPYRGRSRGAARRAGRGRAGGRGARGGGPPAS